MPMPSESELPALIAAKKLWLISFPWGRSTPHAEEELALGRLAYFLLLDEVCAKELRPDEDLDWDGFLDGPEGHDAFLKHLQAEYIKRGFRCEDEVPGTVGRYDLVVRHVHHEFPIKIIEYGDTCRWAKLFAALCMEGFHTFEYIFYTRQRLRFFRSRGPESLLVYCPQEFPGRWWGLKGESDR